MKMRLTQPREGALAAVGGLVSVLVAIALYTRYHLNGSLGRDEAIYAYSGQRMAHGTAPYASIFDPKTPFASMLAGAGAALARLTGSYDITVIRLAFFVASVLTVLAVFLLGRELWHSTLAGLACAVVFASFDGFANDALAGPDAKTPGVLFGVASMWLVLRRQWFLGGFAGALAFLVWQPFGIYSVAAIAFAAIVADGERAGATLKAVLGSAVPLVATGLYFLAEGAFGDFVDAAFRFPLEGVRRPPETVGDRLQRIGDVVQKYYHASGVFFWVGTIALALLVIGLLVRAVLTRKAQAWRALGDPLVIVVFVTGLAEFAYAAHDFQGYPDVFPLLPYGALGIGGLVAVALAGLRRLPVARIEVVWRSVAAVVVLGALVLTAFSWQHFTDAQKNNHALRAERVDACALNRVILPHTVLVSLGDPVPLTLTHRVNPDAYIYLGSGVDYWKIHHEKGGFRGWTRQIAHSHFSALTIGTWHSPLRKRMGAWLKAHYTHRGFLGPWRVFLSNRAHKLIHPRGLKLTHRHTKFPRTAKGARFTDRTC